MNVFTFTGNLGKDAEQRFTAGGDSIVSFSVPVKSGYGDKAVTSWIKCSMFGNRGTSILPYLKKGQLVGVSGEFSARPWTNKDGQEQISNEVRVNDVNLLGSKPEGQQQAKSKEHPPSGNKPKPQFDDLGDDIPFN